MAGWTSRRHALLLPMIGADYRLIENYRFGRVEPLCPPVAVFRDVQDTDVDDEQAAAWAGLSAASHVYVRHNVYEIWRELIAELEK